MNILTLIIGALVLGSIYSIVGMGYCVIYKSSGLMNLSQGQFVMVGAYLGGTFFTILRLPYLLSLALTIVSMFILGIVIQRVVIVNLLKRSSNYSFVIVCTSAISDLLMYGSMFIWGVNVFHFPSVFNMTFVKVLGVQVSPETLLLIGLSFISMIGLYLFLNKTKFGIAMKAEAMDGMAASSVGINVPAVRSIAWGISAAIAGVVGFAIGPVYGVFLTMGAVYTPKGYSSAIFGGYGNIYGALVGGMFFGFLETFVSAFVTASYKDVVTFAVLILMLTFRPNGLFNEPVIE